MVGALAHDHLADHAVGDGLLGLPPDVGGRGLRANLEDALGFLDRVDQLVRFLVGVDHGLFQVDVLAVVHGVEGDLAVPVIGGGDDDGIHICLGQQLAVIEVAVDLVKLGAGALALFVDVADGDDVAGAVVLRGVFGELPGHVTAAAAVADHGDIDAIVGAEDPAGLAGLTGQRFVGGAEGKPTRAHGLQEIPAIGFGHETPPCWCEIHYRRMRRRRTIGVGPKPPARCAKAMPAGTRLICFHKLTVSPADFSREVPVGRRKRMPHLGIVTAPGETGCYDRGDDSQPAGCDAQAAHSGREEPDCRRQR